MMSHHDTPLTLIPELTSSTGEYISSSEDILNEFQGFYQALFSTMLPPDPGEKASLLDPLALGWLSDSERSHPVRPITAEEVHAIINSLATRKSLGPDGIPVEFYKTHADLLAPLLASLYTQCMEGGALPPFMADAHVVLILKPNKDPKLCASYRPIALLNIDLKMLSKLITVRLNPLLPSVIDSDQTGFMTMASPQTLTFVGFSLIYMPNMRMWALEWSPLLISRRHLTRLNDLSLGKFSGGWDFHWFLSSGCEPYIGHHGLPFN